MAFHVSLLLGATLIVAIGIFAVVWRIHTTLNDENLGGVETDQLRSAISESWREMDFDDEVTRLAQQADEIEDLHTDIEEMLRMPQERGEFGEQQLDILLSNHLPDDMYAIQTEVLDGKRPDAHIQSSEGIICIDSKFPLDNYRKLQEADTDDERDEYKQSFRRDVKTKLEKISDDYVRLDEDSAAFAFAFIPTESVFYHLLAEEFDLLQEYMTEGVQVVSPLTLGQKLQLIRANVQAQQLNEQAEQIQRQLKTLAAYFDDVENEWETLRRHIRNAENRANDLDQKYDSLRAEFDRIEQPNIDS